MGLDMYLEGHVYLFSNYEDPSLDIYEEGFRLKEKIFEIGYWRKHPDLHGFIVQTFADGEDDCRPIEMGSDEIYKILEAVETDQLPHTEGFFFGESQPEYKAETIEILNGALRWLSVANAQSSRWISYRASW
jgi:hypothetical protein